MKTFHQALARVRFISKVIPELGIPKKGLTKPTTEILLNQLEQTIDEIKLPLSRLAQFNIDLYYRYFCALDPANKDKAPLRVYLDYFPTGKATISLFKITQEFFMLAKLKEYKQRTGYPQCNLRRLKSEQLCRLYFYHIPEYIPTVKELRRLCKSLGIRTQRVGYKDMILKVGNILGRPATKEDIPSETATVPIPFRALRKGCRIIKQSTGLPISLNAPKNELGQYFVKNAHKVALPAELSQYTVYCN